MKILTEEEHKRFIHQGCGLTGERIDLLIAINESPCDSCPMERWVNCLASHAIVGADAENRLAAERAGVDLLLMYEHAWRMLHGEENSYC